MEVINFKEKADAITKLFEYHLLTKVNDHTFTIVKAQGKTLDFHTHPLCDEAFFVVEGTMKIEFRDRLVQLREGDMLVIPKGAEHRPVCEEFVTCLVIAIEGSTKDAPKFRKPT